MRPWLRTGIVFGAAAAIATIVVNVLGSMSRPVDICAQSPGGVPLGLSGIILFVVIAGAAGWQTTRTGSPISHGALAGLLTGAVSGIPVLAAILLSLDTAVKAAHLCIKSATPPSDDVVRLIGITVAVIIVAVGLGVGAAAGAAGGAIGERRNSA